MEARPERKLLIKQGNNREDTICTRGKGSPDLPTAVSVGFKILYAHAGRDHRPGQASFRML